MIRSITGILLILLTTFSVASELTDKLNHLSGKYSFTFLELETDTFFTEKFFSQFL